MFYYTEQLIDHKQKRDNSGKIEWRDNDKNKKESSQEVTEIFWKYTWKPWRCGTRIWRRIGDIKGAQLKYERRWTDH